MPIINILNSGGAAPVPVTETFDTPGTDTWISPITGNVTVQGWGGGGNGNNGAMGNGGRGGGGSAWGQSVISVGLDVEYSLFVGDVGQDSWFVNDTTFLIKGTTTNIGGAAGSCIAESKFSGGDAGNSGPALSGGGGGGAAGSTENGNNGEMGQVATDAAGGDGGTVGGGDGGDGSFLANGGVGTQPGGGGGGGFPTGTGGAGAAGKLILTYEM